MRVAIITFQDAINYGAVLQAYALKTAVENLGVSCDVINYYNEHFHRSNADGLVQKLINLLHYIANINKRKRFAKFLDKYVTKRKPFLYDKDMPELNTDYDLFITGSDQVWNLICSGNKKAYFLDFVSDNNKKNSYAASFGADYIENTELVKSLLQNFNNISVREESGSVIIKELLNKTVPVVLDPVFLIENKEWNCLKVQNKKTRYIFVYEVINGLKIENYAKKLSAKTGLPIVLITSSNKVKRGMQTVRDAGPQEWITLLADSEYVITNSFHGLAFAILYNRQFFIELLPNGNKTNSRIIELLEKLDLKDRVIKESCSLSERIDYDIVNHKLLPLKLISEEYLLKVLKKNKK